ncbi:MAG: tyrosine-type recombinase/integrase [Pseudomonadota bacterium]|nr:tyrosine-type recombinase/integrase [Pseudomonadota bacterium]
MATNRLTSLSIRNAFKPASASGQESVVSDGDGLSLIVRPDGTGLWRFRYRWVGKQQMLSAGRWPEVQLAEARVTRQRFRAELREGRNPSNLRKPVRKAGTSGAPSFESVAREWHSARKNRWRPKHTAQVLRSLEVNVFPVFGAKSFELIDREDVLAALTPMIKRDALELATRVWQRVRDVFLFAIDKGVTERNPAESVRRALPTPVKGQLPALPPSSLNELTEAIEHYPGRTETVAALKLLLLTFVRPGELRAAEWAEFDLAGAIWRIPETRMKRNLAHLVPLATQTVSLLRELSQLTGNGRFLFPSLTSERRPISDNTLNQALKRSGFHGRHVAHGFRSLASTWLNETGEFPSDVIEKQLAHESADPVRAAYNRAEYLDQRRLMMQVWADHVEATTRKQQRS